MENYPYPDPRDARNAELSEEVNENLAAMNISSGQDCTGLIPAAPSPREEENYSELYDFLPKAVSDGKNDGC